MSGSAELPMLSAAPACPAALAIAGAARSQQGVVCRIYERDAEEHAGTGMSAGQLGVLRSAEGGKYLNLKSDPATVTGFCHGRAVPVLTSDDDQGRASYTYCPVWQADRDRSLEGRAELVVEQEPESVAMGVPELEEEFVSSDVAEDPWAAARRGVDVLAPERRAA